MISRRRFVGVAVASPALAPRSRWRRATRAAPSGSSSRGRRAGWSTPRAHRGRGAVQSLGQSTVVENVPGVAGTGADQVARAVPTATRC